MTHLLLTIYILIAVLLFIYILNHRTGGPIPDDQMDFMDWLWFFIALAAFCLSWPALILAYTFNFIGDEDNNDEF